MLTPGAPTCATDLISQLLVAESDGGKLSEDELVTTCILILNAGHEATVHAHRKWREGDARARRRSPCEAFASEKARAATIEELLRLDPPLHLFARYALDDVEFADVSLKKGEKIGLLLGAANRDPERFRDPDAFDAGRDPNPHVAFGAGIHFCVGAPLARLEMAITLPILFDRLPALRLAESPRYRDAYHFHGLEALKVAWG